MLIGVSGADGFTISQETVYPVEVSIVRLISPLTVEEAYG